MMKIMRNQTKKERQIALVRHRLAMLQEDTSQDFEHCDHHHDTANAHPVTVDIPMLCGSQNAEEARVKSVNDQVFEEDGQIKVSSLKQKRFARKTKPSMNVSDGESSEAILVKRSDNRKKHGSSKRVRVVSDDESSEDEDVIVSDTQRKKTSCRSKQMRISTDVIVHHENDQIPDKERKTRIRRSNNGNHLSVTSPAVKKAEEVKAMLPANHHSFVKLMLKSHVSGGFWLGLPSKFCEEYMPLSDTEMVLVDENGKESIAKYLCHKNGLSGGWRGFSIDHDLKEGDVAVFELIKKTIFKVYIIRANALGEIDGALGLLNLDACVGPGILVEDQANKVNDAEGSPALLDDGVQGTSDVELGPEVVDGLSFSDEVISIESMESFDSFKIIVDGLVIDSKFPRNSKEKYYELCRSQGTCLHDHLLKGLNCNLVVGIILETINIADAIRACKPSLPDDDLLIWERTMKSFEILGMNVSFLRAKLNLLLGVTSESESVAESAWLEKARHEQARETEKMQDLENKLLKLKENLKLINVELESQILASAQKRERLIREIVNAPW